MDNPATSDVAFVRKDMLPEKTAPIGEVGLLFWLRKNMFSSWLNGAMSIAALTFIYICLRGIVPWLIAPTWNADNLIECYEILLSQNKTGEFSGACWGVIRARWLQLLFGFYPADAYWRPILSLVLLVVAIAPVLFSGVPRKMLWFSALYPLIMVWLLWGWKYLDSHAGDCWSWGCLWRVLYRVQIYGRAVWDYHFRPCRDCLDVCFAEYQCLFQRWFYLFTDGFCHYYRAKYD